MAKSLVVVESPAKAKTINKYLGRDYKVVASMGHVRDLPKSKLGVDIDNDFEETYESIESRKKVIKELKDAAQRVVAAASGQTDEEQAAVHRTRFLRTWTGTDGAFHLQGRMTKADGAKVPSPKMPLYIPPGQDVPVNIKYTPATVNKPGSIDMCTVQVASNTANQKTTIVEGVGG